MQKWQPKVPCPYAMFEIHEDWKKKCMLHAKVLNNRINGLHHRALRITYHDRISSFDKSLKIDKSLSNYHRNLQYFLKWDCLHQSWMTFLDQNASYNLRIGVIVTRRNIRTNKLDFETVSTIVSIFWRKLKNDLKCS